MSFSNDATSIFKPGSGGEYEVQLGFGWSNGVVLDFLDMYNDQISTHGRPDEVIQSQEIAMREL